MSNAMQLYSLSNDQIVDAIIAGGTHRTFVIEGEMGIGKTALGKVIAARLGMRFCHFDCTTKDLGDLYLPNIMQASDEHTDYVRYSPNEEFGVHLGEPIVLMLDEIGKTNRATANGLMRTLHPDSDGVRWIGNTPLPAGSVVFGTTNLGAEGVGDMFQPHQYNRMTFLRQRKPTADEWIEWGLRNEVDPIVLSWVKDTPECMQSFIDVDDAGQNEFIYHPQAQRRSFVTPRSLESASDLIKQRHQFDDKTLTAMLIGTVGEVAGMRIATHVEVSKEMPSLDDIINRPTKAKVPKSSAAAIMTVYRTLATIERSWVDAWMTYMERLDAPVQAYFATSVAKPKYPKADILFTNGKYTKWCRDNNHMFAADKAAPKKWTGS